MRHPRRSSNGIAGSLRAQSVELTGPESGTLAPPPRRRTGMVVGIVVSALVVASLVGTLVASPEIVITAVQAFAGGGL